jgi:hypothetical protein
VNRFYFFQLLFCAVAIGVGYLILGIGNDLRGFSYGAVVFCLNLGLLMLVVKWVFSMVRPSVESRPLSRARLARNFLVMVFLVVVKLGFVGVTVYFGLVRWNFPTLYFVAGGLFGLGSAAVLGTRCQSLLMAEAASVS